MCRVFVDETPINYVVVVGSGIAREVVVMPIIIIIIIYHDFLPPTRRGSHVKSDNTHIHQHTPLNPYIIIITVYDMQLTIRNN